MLAAARSVGFTLVLLLILLYVRISDSKSPFFGDAKHRGLLLARGGAEWGGRGRWEWYVKHKNMVHGT